MLEEEHSALFYHLSLRSWFCLFLSGRFTYLKFSFDLIRYFKLLYYSCMTLSVRYSMFTCRKIITTVQVPKFPTLLSLFSNKMLAIKAGIHKMLVRIGEDPDQTASALFF